MHLPLIQEQDGASPLANRLSKRYRHIRKWAQRTATNAFRLYDRDIKEFPFTIDYYDGRFLVNYFSFDGEEDPREDFQQIVHETLEGMFGHGLKIYSRMRHKRAKFEQYEKLSSESHFFPVLEYGVKFLINLEDYLDTGLFLDHRETRQLAAHLARGKRLLNLFAYTCSFSVQAAAKGAAFTKSVDLSNTYTEWGRENFRLNQLPLESNPIIRADCIQFLREEKGQYDVIVIDPPTLSRSKKMEDLFDVQQDYVDLLQDALRLLAKEGTILFSTNLRSFVFDLSYFSACSVKELTPKTLPLDFHNQKIHKCWQIKKICNSKEG